MPRSPFPARRLTVPHASRSALLTLICLLAAASSLAACGEPEEGGDPAGGPAELASCTPGSLDTFAAGTLTIATDSPAYPPYFVGDDPTSGKGFESAVGYAIAEQLGFSREDVEWTVVPFNSSYAPGRKDFDLDLNQISITPQREEAVDFSSPYYEAPQAVVALKGTGAAAARSLADLAGARIGVQVGTTSLDAVNESIQPEAEPRVYDASTDVVDALRRGQVDAVVVDTPTALYMTAEQVPAATIVGEFPAPGGDKWGALLAKGSPLTGCVTAAVDELRESGELDRLEQRWINDAGGVKPLE